MSLLLGPPPAPSCSKRRRGKSEETIEEEKQVALLILAMAATRATAAVAASVLRGVCVRNGHAAARPRRWCRPLSPVSRWSSSAAEASAATDGDRREQRVGAWSYGSGYLGALGHGSLHDADRPTLVRELAEVGADVTSIDCGWCALQRRTRCC